MLLFIVVSMCFAMVLTGRSDKANSVNNKGDDFMFWKKQICSKCKTGKYNYELDPKSNMCPNIHCLKNGKCQFYVPLEKNLKICIFKKNKIWKNI